MSGRESTIGRGSSSGRGASRGGRHDGATHPRPKKVAPVVSVDILMNDGSNLIMWLSKLSNYFQASYGLNGKFIMDGGLRVISTPTQADIAAQFPGLAQTVFLKLYSEVLSSSYKQSESMRSDNVEIFGFILQCLSDEGAERVKSNPGYTAIRYSDNPHSLIELIKQVHIDRTVGQSPANRMYKADRRYQLIQQPTWASLSVYKDNFEFAVSNIVTAGGIPANIADQARHFFMGLDKSRYEGYVQYTLNNERQSIGVFPVTIAAVIAGAESFLSTTQSFARSRSIAYTFRKGRCNICDMEGHLANECPQKKSKVTNRDSANVARSSGVTSDIAAPSGDAAVSGKKKKMKPKPHPGVKANAMIANDDNDFFGYIIQLSANLMSSKLEFHPFDVSIDSFANHSFGHNKALCINITNAEFSVSGSTGNGKGTELGTLPCFGSFAVLPQSKVNAICLHDVEEHEVEYVKRSHYIVVINKRVHIKFAYREATRSYTCRFTAKLLDTLKREHGSVTAYTSTVNIRQSEYTRSEVNAADAARELSHRLSYPSDAALIATINSGALLNSKVTAADVLRATDIYGQDIASLKGKTVDRGPRNVNRVAVPKSLQRQQIASTDVFHWKGVDFLLCTLRPLGLTIVQHLPSKSFSAADIKRALDEIKAKVHQRGYEIILFASDPGSVFTKCARELDIHMDIAGARSHVPTAEREIRLVKERCRATLAGVPFNVPTIMIRYLVTGVVSSLNSVLREGQTVLPRELFTGVKADASKDLRAAFGDYAQAHVITEPRNGPQPRTVGCVLMCATGNNQGSYFVFNLNTGKVFSTDRWTPLPMPDQAIDRLNQIADGDGDVEDVVEDVATVDSSEAEHEIIREFAELPAERIEPEAAEELPLEVDPVLPDEPTVDRKKLASEAVRRRFANRLSLKKGIVKFGDVARAAVREEMTQMHRRKVFQYLSRTDITAKRKLRMIRSSMFLKEKYLASGLFEKLKARLVAGGDQQLRELYEQVTASPTAASEATMIVIAIAAAELRSMIVIDIVAAYLEAPMPDDMEEVIMVLDAITTKILLEIDPAAKPYIADNGTMTVKLKKALYGCLQSAKLWYDRLTGVLTAKGFAANDYDPCVFNQGTGAEQVTVVFHVDDLLITSKSKLALAALCDHLKDSFDEIKINDSGEFSYLSMRIRRKADTIEVDMQGYIEKCLQGKNIGRTAVTPAKDGLFDIDPDSVLLSQSDGECFHSDVARLLYLAKRARPEILTAISFLSSRVAVPTTEDDEKLKRVFSYLKGTAGLKLVFKAGVVSPVSYVDASFGVHSDGSSRTGIVLMLAGGVVGVWSNRQHIVVKSATEAEIVAMSDGLEKVLWAREFLISQGYAIDPVVVYEDNSGVLAIAKNGRKPQHRTRHLNVRYFFVIDRVKLGHVRLEYMPTKSMIADMMTKAVNGALFQDLRNLLFGIGGPSNVLHDSSTERVENSRDTDKLYEKA